MMAVGAVPAMLAPVLGPVLGGLIVGHLTWRWLFLVDVPVCAVAIALAVRLLSSDDVRPDVRIRLDVIGLVLLSPGLAALVYGLSEAGNGAGLASTRVLVAVATGTALLVAGVAHAARRGAAALVDVRLFTRRSFAFPTAGLFAYALGLFGVMVLLPLCFQLVRGAGSLEAGLRPAPLGIGAVLTMAVSGRLADRYGPRWIAAGASQWCSPG